MKVIKAYTFLPGEVEITVDTEIARAVAHMVLARGLNTIADTLIYTGDSIDVEKITDTDPDKIKQGRDEINKYLMLMERIAEAEEKAAEREAGGNG